MPVYSRNRGRICSWPRLSSIFRVRSRAAHLRDIHIGRIESLRRNPYKPRRRNSARSAVVGHDDNGRPPSRRAKSSATPTPCRRQHLVITPTGSLACAHIDAAASTIRKKPFSCLSSTSSALAVISASEAVRHRSGRGRNSCSPARRATTRGLCRRKRGTRGILLDKRRAAAAQIRPHGVRDLLPAAAEHHVKSLAAICAASAG